MNECPVCVAPVRLPGVLLLHVVSEHPALMREFNYFHDIADEPGAALRSFMAAIRTREIRVQALDRKRRPLHDTVTVRLCINTGWGWCPGCRTTERPFDLFGHLNTDAHKALFGPATDLLDVVVGDDNVWR